MKPAQLLLLGLFSIASTAALAADGSERSSRLLAEFHQQQQKTHGTQTSTAPKTAEGKTDQQTAKSGSKT